jgi:hypothetical protein
VSTIFKQIPMCVVSHQWVGSWFSAAGAHKRRKLIAILAFHVENYYCCRRPRADSLARALSLSIKRMHHCFIFDEKLIAFGDARLGAQRRESRKKATAALGIRGKGWGRTDCVYVGAKRIRSERDANYSPAEQNRRRLFLGRTTLVLSAASWLCAVYIWFCQHNN